MNFHADVLDTQQREILPQLAPVMTQEGFYLGGGTAVALHLGHRHSQDFDWFTAGALGDPLALGARLQALGLPLVIEEVARATLHGRIGGVRVSFLQYDYPLLHSPLVWPTYGCVLAVLDDLACMKLVAIAQRGSRKDFVDLYALGVTGFSLEYMLDLYQRKYHIEDIGHLLYALVYFEDAEQEPSPSMIWDIEWAEVKAAIRNWVKVVGGA